MSEFGKKLYSKDPWSGLMMGNHALVRAMLEAEVKVATTYPGSPTPEIADAILTMSEEERGFYFQYSTNEKVALEVAFGAAVNGHLSTVFFKSVGLNVAADSCVQLGHMEIIGGMVIILGDDPGANSSQNEQDNRLFARMSYIPVFEPSTPQEAYEMFLSAADIAVRHKMPVFLRMTTHVCHAKEVVSFGEIPESDYNWKPEFNKANGPYLPIAAAVYPLKRRAYEKLDFLVEEGSTGKYNTVYKPHGLSAIDGKRLGIISASMPALSVLENLDKAEEPISLLKLGLTYPLPDKLILEYLDDHDEVLIVEELERVMEQEIKTLAYDHEIKCRILSRLGTEYLMGELDAGRTQNILADTWPELIERVEIRTSSNAPLPRTPQMCPGCGHRSAFHSIKKALPEGTITVGDIGCHSLGFFEPYNIGEVLLCMGHSNGTGAGLSINNDSRKIVTFIGDSTFFHAGIPAIINAVLYDHNMTLIVMDNGTTAMTGHQPHPGTGEIADKIPIKRVLEGIGVKHISETDTYDQKKLTELVKESMAMEGFSVVIAKHPCMLKFVKEQRKKSGWKPIKVEVDQDKCEKIYECVSDFGCPSFVKHDDGTVTVHKDLCIGDGSCKQTCPSTAIQHPTGKVKK